MWHNQEFKVAGTFNFHVPVAVSCIFITAVAGGGAGAWDEEFPVAVHGGGSGGFCYRKPLPVIPDADIVVIIGIGGISVYGVGGFDPVFTGNGTDTSVGGLKVSGGLGGFWSGYDAAHAGSIYGGVGGNAAGVSYEALVFDGNVPPPHVVHGVLYPDTGFLSIENPKGWFGGSSGGTGGGGGLHGTPGQKGGDAANGFVGGPGGLGGLDGSSGAGGGAASPFGNGGAGATRISMLGDDGFAPTSTAYGAGGGGSVGTGKIGGSGMHGYAMIEWCSNT